MEAPEEYGKRIQKEIAKMYPKKWFEMYFSEQQEAIKKDRKHNYEHIILKIGDEYCDKLSLEYQKYLDKRIKQSEQHKEIINKIHEEYKHQLAEKDKEIEEYNNYFKAFGCKNFAEFQELIGLAKVSVNDKDRDNWVCHQICKKIRDWYRKNDLLIEEWLKDCLDQIEQGEE